MNDLLTTVCCDDGVLSGELVASIIEGGVGFSPDVFAAIDISRRDQKYNARKHLLQLRRLKRVTALRLETGDGLAGPSFSVSTIGAWGFQALYWRLPFDLSPDNGLIDRLMGVKGFNCAYMCDYDDVSWQSEERLENYGLFKRDASNVVLVDDEVFGGKKVDIFKNPGARYPFPGMWIQAAWRMWFSGSSFKYFPRERLLSFCDAEVVKEVSAGSIFVQLYGQPQNFDKKENRERQVAFRQWLGMVEYARRAEDFSTSLDDDPEIEIEYGTFANGGELVIISWLDGSGALTRRSQAAKKVIEERLRDGTVVNRAEAAL